MKIDFLRPSLEKDFEFFVRSLPKLDAIEFCGMAKILGVSLHKVVGIESVKPEDLKVMDKEEEYQLKMEMIVPTDEILEKMMDRYLELPKRRRKEINQILKDVKRGR